MLLQTRDRPHGPLRAICQDAFFVKICIGYSDGIVDTHFNLSPLTCLFYLFWETTAATQADLRVARLN